MGKSKTLTKIIKCLISNPKYNKISLTKENNVHIIVAGHGNMAKAIIAECQFQNVPFSQWEDGYVLKSDPSETVCIHVGSGLQLPKIIEAFNQIEDGPTILQGSSEIDLLIPKDLKCNIIQTPNFAMPILAFIDMLPDVMQMLGDPDDVKSIRIIESHQGIKKSPPGTAIAMAAAVGLSKASVVSIRDVDTQTILGVPKGYLDSHGYHWVELEVDGVKIVLSTQVNGRAAYAKGALRIADHVVGCWSMLLGGLYTINGWYEIHPVQAT